MDRCGWCPPRHRCPPTRKGRLGRPVEFGYKAQVLDNTDGIVLDHDVVIGNPFGAPLLASGHRARHRVVGPRPEGGDRGSGL